MALLQPVLDEIGIWAGALERQNPVVAFGGGIIGHGRVFAPGTDGSTRNMEREHMFVLRSLYSWILDGGQGQDYISLVRMPWHVACTMDLVPADVDSSQACPSLRCLGLIALPTVLLSSLSQGILHSILCRFTFPTFLRSAVARSASWKSV